MFPFKHPKKKNLNMRWLKTLGGTYANGDPIYHYTLQAYDDTTKKWITVPAFEEVKGKLQKVESPIIAKSY